MLKKLYPLSSLQVLDWKIDHPEKEVPLTREQLQLQVRDFMSFSSGRMFLPLIPLNRAEQVPARLKEIGRASGREGSVSVREDHGGRRIIKKKTVRDTEEVSTRHKVNK